MRNPRKYPFYNEDRSFEKKLIVERTYDGGLEYRVNCVKYPDGFYVKEKDLVYMEDTKKWTKKKNLIFDYEKEVYVRQKDNTLINGIVEISPQGEPIIGYYSPNQYQNCVVHLSDRGKISCINPDILPSEYYKEDLSTGIFYHIRGLEIGTIKTLGKKRLSLNNSRNVYNAVDNMEAFQSKRKSYEDYKINIDKDLKYAGKYLSELTYGIEIESINGTLPDYLCNRYGIIICRDGSLRTREGAYPPEYVTVPYKGAKGLQSIRNVSKEISKRSDISEKCSLHIHMGGFDVDRMFMVSLYHLCQKVQDEIFDLFPYYKRDEVRYANKEKNYCQKIPDLFRPFGSGDFNNYINDSYENLYTFITKKRFNRTSNVSARQNPFGGNKWDIPTRYYWINFTNIFFGKQDTVEFRIHTPTTNSDKIINWLFMCSALIQYAINNPKICLSKKPISFRNDVLKIYQDKSKSRYAKHLVEKLQEYYDFRKNYFAKHTTNDNYLCPEELKEDSTFNFNITNV